MLQFDFREGVRDMKAYRAAILSFSGAGAEVQAHW